MSGTIYGKNKANINMNSANRAILNEAKGNGNILNRQEEFMNVIRKVFLVNLQKDDLFRVFEGRTVSGNEGFKKIIANINQQIKSAKAKNGKSIKQVIQEMISEENKTFTPSNGLNQPISKSILLLYAVLYDLVELVQEKLAEYDVNGTPEGKRTQIYHSLLHLARKYIRLREKIFNFFPPHSSE